MSKVFSRRVFVQHAGAAGVASFLPFIAGQGSGASLFTADPDLILGPDEGDGIPVHKHGAEEELIHIERGRGVVTFGDAEYDVGSGSMALIPRGIWHGFSNTRDDLLRMVFGYTPAGFEGYFREIGVRPGESWKGLTSEEWQRINSRYNIVYR